MVAFHSNDAGIQYASSSMSSSLDSSKNRSVTRAVQTYCHMYSNGESQPYDNNDENLRLVFPQGNVKVTCTKRMIFTGNHGFDSEPERSFGNYKK